jgi:tetratricopeptide (TPR) repeat protein
VEYLEELRASSLVLTEGTPEEVGGMRFRMLETLREYAREQLSPEQRASIQKGHAEYYLAVAEEAAAKREGPDEKLWLDRQETEHDNLREGLAWCMLAEGDIDTGLELVGALGGFWYTRGHWREGLARATEMLAREGASARTAARAQALLTAAHLADELLDQAGARRMWQESLDIFRELGHQRGIAVALTCLGRIVNREGDYTAARALAEEGLAIAREIGDEDRIASLLLVLGNVARNEGDHAVALSLFEEGMRVARRSGQRHLAANVALYLGRELTHGGDLRRAGALFQEALSVAREIGDRWLTGQVLQQLAAVAEKQGDEASVQTFREESKAIFLELGGDVERMHALFHRWDSVTTAKNLP